MAVNRKPWAIQVFSVAFLLVPLAVLLSLGLTPDEDGKKWEFTSISLDLVMFSIGSYVAGLGVWQVRPWGYFFLYGFSTSVMGYLAYLYFTEPGTLGAGAMMILGLNLAATLALLRGSTAAPFFNPALRWWKWPRRVQANLTADCVTPVGTVQILVLDISESGIFASIPMDLAVGEDVNIHLKVVDTTLELGARIMRKSEVPPGYGLQFHPQGFRTRTSLKFIVHRLSKK